MEQRQQRELEIHLVEYKRLADELTRDTQSIDRYLALYLMAFFAVLAFMIQSGTGIDGVNYIEAVKLSPDLIFLALLVPIVNGVLVVRIAHLTSQMFARAQHIHRLGADRTGRTEERDPGPSGAPSRGEPGHQAPTISR